MLIFIPSGWNFAYLEMIMPVNKKLYASLLKKINTSLEGQKQIYFRILNTIHLV